MRYSNTTKTFYPEGTDYGDGLPEDLVTVSDENYNEIRSTVRKAGDYLDLVDGFVRIVSPAPSANAIINDQIFALEGSITDRMRREAISGALETFPANHPKWPGLTSMQAIVEINSQIKSLRSQLT